MSDDSHPGAPSDPPPSPAAAAPNWRTVIAVDVGLGIAVVVAGIVAAMTWVPVVGAGVSSLGLTYAVLAARRGTRWAAWRRRNGLA
jgi:hypothetical protein